MSYTLRAFIAKAGAFILCQTLNPDITIVSLPQGFEMIFTDKTLQETIGAQVEFAQAQPRLAELKRAQAELAQMRENVEESFPSRCLTDALVAFALSISQQHPIAYVEAEFFGGIGEQYAVLWDKGQIVLLPSTNGLTSNRYPDHNFVFLKDAPINSVLRVLGAQADKYDEFSALRLVDWR